MSKEIVELLKRGSLSYTEALFLTIDQFQRDEIDSKTMVYTIDKLTKEAKKNYK